ncbi:hypothetical protein Lalb_Chr19g0139601 [Lupinus albus]|uniref:Uncharacterized protein n=1 Tax=Lupinus albus TaxID=3870 RepID=A0A6A4NRR2_LUPAL|nr:hypothetical protein Lalb_Chr19g0139601 [Lupinus albus]
MKKLFLLHFMILQCLFKSAELQIIFMLSFNNLLLQFLVTQLKLFIFLSTSLHFLFCS